MNKKKRRFFSPWVNRPIERVLAVLILIALAIGVIAEIGVFVSDRAGFSEYYTEWLKTITFLALGGMCHLGWILYAVDLSASASKGKVWAEFKLLFQPRKKKKSYKYRMIYKNIFLLLTIGTIFTGIGIYLFLHIPPA